MFVFLSVYFGYTFILPRQLANAARTEAQRPLPHFLPPATPSPTPTPLHPSHIMSRNAQVEELSDSDPDEIAPSDSSFSDNVIIEPVAPRPANPPPRPAPAQPMQQPMAQVPEPTREIPKHFQCLYPIYFDKTRSRADGRKVGSELAVENPLARDIVDAVQMLGLQAGLEPEKLHPKDWANPGRVRVLLKNEDGKSMNSKIKNSKWFNDLRASTEPPRGISTRFVGHD